jgi:hypothetical protein
MIKARIFCPTHGRLSLDDVVIKDGKPVCKKCSAVLVYGEVKPRKLEKVKKKVKKRKGRKRKKRKSK